jgi:hypothetical protein
LGGGFAISLSLVRTIGLATAGVKLV